MSRISALPPLHGSVSRRTVIAATAVGGLAASSRALSGRAAQSTQSRSEASPVASPAASPIGDLPHATGPTDVLLRVELIGGFVPPVYNLSKPPEFTLFGDGLVVTQGPQIEVFPAPALPNLRSLRISEAGIQAVLREAEAAGLFEGSADYLNDRIADAPTTVFTLNAGDVETTVTAYALGFEAGPNADPDDREAQQRLIDLLGWLVALDLALPAESILEPDRAFPIDRLQIISQPYEEALGMIEPGMEQEEQDWPLDAPLAAFGDDELFPNYDGLWRCGVVEGEDAATLVDVLQEANALTPFVSDDADYLLTARPLLPDESGCQAAG